MFEISFEAMIQIMQLLTSCGKILVSLDNVCHFVFNSSYPFIIDASGCVFTIIVQPLFLLFQELQYWGCLFVLCELFMTAYYLLLPAVYQRL